MPESLPEQLSREVERVTSIRERYMHLTDTPGVIVSPVVYLINAALEAAHKSAGYGDLGDMVAALRELKGFEG